MIVVGQPHTLDSKASSLDNCEDSGRLVHDSGVDQKMVYL